MSNRMQFVCLTALATLAVLTPSTAQSFAQSVQTEHLSLKSLTITDDLGRPRITLSVQKGEPRIVLHDERKKWRVALMQSRLGGTVLVKGAGLRPDVRIVAGDSGRIELLDKLGRVRTTFGMTDDGVPQVIRFDEKGVKIQGE